jgi:hypothetical protein
VSPAVTKGEPPLRFDLLDSLDARFQAMKPPPPLKGSFAVGIRTGAEERWWLVTLSERIETGFSDRPPPRFDAILLLGAADAQMILQRGRLPQKPELLRYDGDKAKMQQFIDLCLKG